MKLSKHMKDITNERYGNIVAVSFTGKRHGKQHSAVWLWECDCGIKFERPLSVVLNYNRRYVERCSTCKASPGYAGPDKAGRNQVVSRYKHAAYKRGLEFCLSVEHLNTLFESDCHYCDAPPENLKEYPSGDFVYQGIDRIDNKLNYVSSNVVPCCAKCNSAKRDMDYGEFREWTRRLSRNWAELG